MTINEMFDELENKVRDTYIVTLKYKYDFEEKYTIENHILEYDCMSDSYVWLNDWNEGQTDVEVLGYILLDDVDTIKTELKPCDTPRTNLAETSQDCVSRQVVLETQVKYAEYMGATKFWQMRDDIRALPPVTPQPKVGEWNYVTHYARRYRVCSECNAEKEDDRATGWNFCPNCGARMNGGGEE